MSDRVDVDALKAWADTALREAHSRPSWREGLSVGEAARLAGDVLALLEHIRQLETLTTEWLAETDDADGDDTTIHDYYVAVGAKWGKGNYYRRFKQLLGSGAAACRGGDA